ncbi:hypothetical protein PF003_g39339 [Phytophthora fragariae]|nr:hypothetical protein PF003_g39339 [Phytophthora fragariae]
MQPDEETWCQAIEDEEAACAVVVEAENALRQLFQHHLASSPTVDDAVSELDLQRSEYARMLRATDQTDAVFHHAQWGVSLHSAITVGWTTNSAFR